MSVLTRSIAPLTLAALLAAACSTPVATATATDSRKGTEPMFGMKKDGLLAVGSKAPEFAVPDHDGNIVRLSDLAGKRVLLWFYPKADTPG